MSKNTELETAKKKEELLDALEACNGSIKAAARIAGITVRTYYRWLKEDNNFDNRAGSVRDICFRNAKEYLLESAMKKIEQGDSAVLNKMLGIFLKELPNEMAILNRYNTVPLRAVIRYVDTPQDPKRLEQEK